jgi:hypothetical protein
VGVSAPELLLLLLLLHVRRWGVGAREVIGDALHVVSMVMVRRRKIIVACAMRERDSHGLPYLSLLVEVIFVE